MSRFEALIDIGHKMALNSLIVIGGLITYNSVLTFIDRRKLKNEWSRSNPKWDTDPFFIYDPNYMRAQKKDEEEILLTRPMWYAAKELREIHGIPLQEPYLPISNPLMGRNGQLVIGNKDGFDGDMAAAAGARR
jgi:hypothetical protein